MSTLASQHASIVRGQSRFQLRVQLSGKGLRPYGWEIFDDEDTKVIRRSLETFRTSADAWTAGTIVLEAA